MATKIQTTPRKEASQKRSIATVDALLEATARILVTEGFDRASTNKIARVAGVGIGSLYQYFPNKEALVGAVVDRHSAEMTQIVRTALAKVAFSPVADAAAALVRVGIDSHRKNPKLHRVLTEQIPRVGRLKNIQDIEHETYKLVEVYLEAHKEELTVSDISLAAFMCVTTVESLTHAAVLNRHDLLDAGKADTFVGEVTTLLLRYLQG